MDVIAAIGAINAILISFFIYNKKEKTVSAKILAIWAFVFALHFSVPFFIERDLLFETSYWGFILGIIIVSHMPLLFVYTNSLVNRNYQLNWKNLWPFIFVLLYLVSLIPMFIMKKEEFLEMIYEKQDLSYHTFLPMMTLLFSQVYFLIRTIIILLKHQYSIKNEFSYEKAIDLAWIKRIVYGFAAIIIFTFIAYGLVSAKLISIYVMDYSSIIANMILFYYIAYSGYKQQTIYQAEKIQTDNGDQHETKSELKEDSLPIEMETSVEADFQHPKMNELLELMTKEKLYLEKELTLGDLANQLRMHAHQLSKMMNENMGKNFFEFVNEYRVEEFKKLAVDPKNKHISILGLAMDAGFNSKATFNRFFKNTTGLTPSEYMSSYKF